MTVHSLLLIAIFQFFNTTMAQWNANTPLYLVDIPTRSRVFTKIFPLEIPSNAWQNELDNAKFYAFCPNPDAPNENCNYGNLKTGVSESMIGQLEKECPYPVVYNVVPDLMAVSNDQMLHIPCVHNQKHGHIYHFVYLLCKDNDKESSGEKIIYKVCYRDDEKQTIYASAAIEKPSLLKAASLQDERTYQFAFDITHWFDDYTRDIVNAWSFFYTQPSNYMPAFVLPPVLFPFAHQRTTVHHQMNLAPMESTLVNQWNLCLHNLVDKLSGFDLGINVYAGLHGVLQDDQGKVLYLGVYNGKEEIPIPSIFWILFASHSHHKGVVIMIHNIDYSRVEIEPNHFFNDDDCTVQVCKDANLKDILPPSESHVYIVCCYPRAINRRFLLGIRNTLLQFPDLPEQD